MEVHRCRFVPYPPSAINALAFSHNSTPNLNSKGPLNLRLAIGRANGDIEVWNPLRGSWHQESIIRGGKDRSIEGLAWIQDPEDVDRNGYKTAGKLRLFSIGYSTVVTEWDLATGKPVQHSTGNYGEIWCMAAQPKGPPAESVTNSSQGQDEEEFAPTQNLAVGCADGAIVLLNTADGDLRFSRILARPSKKKSRVLSITFQNRYTIVAGHADSTIRIHDIRNKQLMRNMTLGAGPRGGPKEILVWSVKCLGDGTIVSGDSTGTLSFWNGKVYSQLQRIKGHEADILDLAVSADGKTVFSGGMDRRTTMYRRMEGGQSGERHRWAKVAHQRFHKHDVKAMASFETKSMSILASGGLDTSPVIVPIQEFGSENHRTLSNLPQQSILRSSPQRRLIASWWDREISIWKILRHRARDTEQGDSSKHDDTAGRKLVAKIALQGEEAINSLDLSTDGTMLAVATTSTLKFFLVRSRAGTFKVQMLQAPTEIVEIGAKLVHISPDQRWLVIIRIDNSVQVCRITEDPKPKKRPQFLPEMVHLRRLPRDPVKMNYQNGTLGEYHRSITRLAFSTDSRILVVGDLSGFLDSWVLEGHEDLTQTLAEGQQNKSSSKVPNDDESDEDSDEEQYPNVILGQHWIRNPSASLLIKLPASPLVLSFRPSFTQPFPGLTNGNLGIHPTRHTPHPHSHDLPDGEDRLCVLTAENQMYEFNVLSGKLSDWSRRNPTSTLPREFRDLRDRAMGVLWDVRKDNQRIWIYGGTWLWMFDLSKDLPAPDDPDRKSVVTTEKHGTKQLKRKRPQGSNDDEFTARSKHDTGAGSKIPRSKLGLGIGSEIRKVKGEDNGLEQLITLAPKQTPTSDEEEDDEDIVLANENDPVAISLHRSVNGEHQPQQNYDEGGTDMDDGTRLVRKNSLEKPCHWHTYKYRPILGIVPIGGENDDEADREGGEADDSPLSGLEVALVERPLWDVDLPPQYHGNQEWNP